MRINLAPRLLQEYALLLPGRVLRVIFGVILMHLPLQGPPI
jgi:hypothetical protein